MSLKIAQRFFLERNKVRNRRIFWTTTENFDEKDEINVDIRCAAAYSRTAVLAMWIYIHCFGVLCYFSPFITDLPSLVSYFNRFKLQQAKLDLRKNNFLIVRIGKHLKSLAVENNRNSITDFNKCLSGMAWGCVKEVENTWVYISGILVFVGLY